MFLTSDMCDNDKINNAYHCGGDVNGAGMAFHKHLHVCGVKMPEDEPMPTLRISEFPEGREGPERASWKKHTKPCDIVASGISIGCIVVLSRYM